MRGTRLCPNTARRTGCPDRKSEPVRGMGRMAGYVRRTGSPSRGNRDTRRTSRPFRSSLDKRRIGCPDRKSEPALRTSRRVPMQKSRDVFHAPALWYVSCCSASAGRRSRPCPPDRKSEPALRTSRRVPMQKSRDVFHAPALWYVSCCSASAGRRSRPCPHSSRPRWPATLGGTRARGGRRRPAGSPSRWRCRCPRSLRRPGSRGRSGR